MPPKEMTMFNVGKLKFDESLLKSLSFEMSRLNTVDETLHDDEKESDSDSKE